MHMQIRERDYNIFRDKLVEGNIYQISKFQISRAKGRNLVTMSEYMLYFTPGTIVKHLGNDPMPYPRYSFHFLDKEKMLPYINTDKYLVGAWLIVVLPMFL